MKTKNVFVAVLLLVMGSFSMKIVAQENLAAMVKKCESIESVDMNIVRQKNPHTKKTESIITSVTIRSNPALVSEFLTAFRKDEDNAYQVVENKQGGKIVPSFCQFKGVSYAFTMQGEGNATVTEIREPIK
ncbi:MAG: DUF5024 domain-containing protein [Candidatus Azobacteroides sp.]|nr:DUF5024 domain-containing protein [Candidatus Azobacteroides sp.]